MPIFTLSFTLIVLYMLCAMPYAFGAGIDVNPDKRGWHIELKRISTNLSSTTISGQDEYVKFSDSRIKGDSQLIAQGHFDLGLDFYAPRYVVFNSTLAEYGRTILVRENEKISNTTLDRILISTDYTHRIWYIPTFAGGFEIGPSIKANYQTGFENKRQITRLNAGIKLFDGVYIKDLHLNAFSEKDFALKENLKTTAGKVASSLNINFNKAQSFIALQFSPLPL